MTQTPYAGATPLGKKLLRSIRQAREWADGKSSDVRVTYVPVPRVDVKSVRRKTGLTQTQFAAKFGFRVESIREWEQRRGEPEGPARTLLAVIEKNAAAVEEALRG